MGGGGGGASKVIYDLDAMGNKLQSMPCGLGLKICEKHSKFSKSVRIVTDYVDTVSGYFVSA